MTSARRIRLLANADYIDVEAPHCVYCLRSGKLSVDHVPAVSRTEKRAGAKNWPGLFTYPACYACNMSLRHFAQICLVLRARQIHEAATRSKATGEKGLAARARAIATLWATSADATSPHCRCRLCRSWHTD